MGESYYDGAEFGRKLQCYKQASGYRYRWTGAGILTRHSSWSSCKKWRYPIEASLIWETCLNISSRLLLGRGVPSIYSHR